MKWKTKRKIILQALQGLIRYDYFIHVLEVQTSNFLCLHELYHFTF